MNRIQKVSRLFRILCGLALVGCCLLALVSVFAPITNPSRMDFHIGTPEAAPAPPMRQTDSAEAPVETKTVNVRFTLGDDDQGGKPAIEEKIKPGFRWITRPLLFGIMLFWIVGIAVLYRLFKLYETGMIFTAANVQCIKWLGAWVLAAWALSNLIEILKLITYDSADVDLRMGSTFFVGLLVLLMSWIMQEGGKIQEECALTI